MKNFIKNLKIISFCIIVFYASFNNIKAQVLAFPKAMGYGAYATGGRAGTVYHVTNLNDAGSGSFRDAVSYPDRIVVFDVGGYIKLLSAVSVSSNITIAGQTAPGEGIGFEGGEISFANSENIICRYIRIRPGSETTSTEDDALSFYDAKNIIVDHVSLEFAPWNNIDGVSDDWQSKPVKNITIQNSIIADPTGQQFGAHTECVQGTWSWFNNIFANSHNRNPLAKINTVFINNILYNCSAGYTTHTSMNFNHDIVNNYFILGPSSSSTDNTWYQIDKNQTMYYSGNLEDKNCDGILNGDTTTPFWYQGSGTILDTPFSSVTKSATIYKPSTAYMLAVSQAGTLPRDAIDSLVINQMKTLGSGAVGTGLGTTGPDGNLYTSQTETGLDNNGYENISGGQKPSDTDNDGIPDYWETAYGSNPIVNDAMSLDKNGYTILEDYINWLAEPNIITKPNEPFDVDISKYSSGFSQSSPSYTFSNVTGGICTLLSDGHTIQFTPSINFTGIAGFDFLLSTSDGTYQSHVGIAITSSEIFSALPVGVSSPTPQNSQKYSGMLSPDITLSWVGGANTNSYIIYFGTDSSNLIEKDWVPYSLYGSYTISNLLYNTRYYWRVDAVGNGDTTKGEGWSFTTGTQTKLVAHYKLDESSGNIAVDASDNHIDGTANFAPDWYPTGGILKGAIAFSQDVESTSSIVVPSSDATLMNSNSFTISLWVKIPSNTYTYSNGKDCYLLQKGTFEATTGKWYGLQLKDGVLTFAIDDGVHKSNLDVHLTDYNNIFNNKWTNIVAVRDTSAKQISLYINGVQAGSVSTSSTTGTIGQAGKSLTIGNSVENKPYRDMMDDIRFYDNVLTPLDISNIYRLQDLITTPVTVMNFNALLESNSVLLTWQTSNEINNDRFEIDKSLDGKNYTLLTTVAGKGNSSDLNNYQVYDNNPMIGKNYYRLVQFDKDGKATNVGIKIISYSYSNSVFKVYPNPVTNGNINFVLSSNFITSSYFSVDIINSQGAVLERKTFVPNSNNIYLLDFDKVVLPGVYFLVIKSAGKKFTQKIIIK